MFGFLKKNKMWNGKVYNKHEIRRLNLRHRFIVEKNAAAIAGARILDLASHDGRWPYSFARAGAREIIGIEGRQSLVDEFEKYPSGPERDIIRLIVGDIAEQMEILVKAGESFDVVSCLGVYYHTMEHYRLMKLMTQLKPKLIIMDSEFALPGWPMMSFGLEATDEGRNAIPTVAGQKMAPVGQVSQVGLEMIVQSLDYKVEWLDWNELGPKEQLIVPDYFRPKNRRRFTCNITPVG